VSLFETSEGIDKEGDARSRTRVAFPVPVALVAATVTLKVPAAALGVPEMRPVVVLMESPPGRPVALKEEGELSAAI
jgi:hypothetical protein